MLSIENTITLRAENNGDLERLQFAIVDARKKALALSRTSKEHDGLWEELDRAASTVASRLFAVLSPRSALLVADSFASRGNEIDTETAKKLLRSLALADGTL